MQLSHTFMSELGALLVLGLHVATASPVEYSDGSLPLDARGNAQSSGGSTPCAGMTLVGYRTVKTKSDGDAVNKNNKFPKAKPNGIDLGTAVYFSEGMGDWVGGGLEAQYCAAFAEPAKIPTWQKAWIPEKYNGQTIRGNDAKLDAYIKEVSRNQFDPSKTLRFSKLTVQTTFNQMAVPFGVIDDICGYCLPQSEATAGGLGGTRVNYESGDFLAMVKQEVTAGACKRGTGSNGAGCTSSSTTSTSSTSSTKATPKAKATPKSKGTKSS